MRCLVARKSAEREPSYAFLLDLRGPEGFVLTLALDDGHSLKTQVVLTVEERPLSMLDKASLACNDRWANLMRDDTVREVSLARLQGCAEHFAQENSELPPLWVRLLWRRIAALAHVVRKREFAYLVILQNYFARPMKLRRFGDF